MQLLSTQSTTTIKAHEKLVEITWDTMAAYLPLMSNNNNNNNIDSNNNNNVSNLVKTKLELIARTCCSTTEKASVV